MVSSVVSEVINTRAARVLIDSTAANSKTSLQTDRVNMHEEAADQGARTSL